jgi:nitrogen PTS system EIIA component
MQLIVRDVARLLKVTEKTIYRWIREGSIPSCKVNEQYRFNRSELLEWATARKIAVPAEFFDEADAETPVTSVADAMLAGGIHHHLSGTDKVTVLTEVVKRIRFPHETDRELFLRVLLAREELSSTGIGDGIAIPHVRNPIVLHVAQPMITLCFLDRPIDFGAMDGKPVHSLFTLISPTVKAHLHLISRLAFALHHPAFSGVVARHAPGDEIMAAIRRVEAGLKQ